MRSIKELKHATNNNKNEEKARELRYEIRETLDRFLEGYGFEEVRPDHFVLEGFEVIITDDNHCELYSYGSQVDYYTWLKFVEEFFDIYIKERNQKVALEMIKHREEKERLHKYGLINTDSWEEKIHVKREFFFQTFEDYGVRTRSDTEYTHELFAFINGVEFFCLITEEQRRGLNL